MVDFKRFLVLSAAAFLSACTNPQATKNAGGAMFDVSAEILAARRDTMIDLGRVREGEVVRYDGQLRNAGSEELVIKDISTSCGCTSVEWEKRPIAPDAAGAFSLKLDTRGMWGVTRKLIEIDTSASPNPYKIMICAEIENLHINQ